MNAKSVAEMFQRLSSRTEPNLEEYNVPYLLKGLHAAAESLEGAGMDVSLVLRPGRQGAGAQPMEGAARVPANATLTVDGTAFDLLVEVERGTVSSLRGYIDGENVLSVGTERENSGAEWMPRFGGDDVEGAIVESVMRRKADAAYLRQFNEPVLPEKPDMVVERNFHVATPLKLKAGT